MYFSIISALWLRIVLFKFDARFPQMDNKDLILSMNLGVMPSNSPRQYSKEGSRCDAMTRMPQMSQQCVHTSLLHYWLPLIN